MRLVESGLGYQIIHYYMVGKMMDYWSKTTSKANSDDPQRFT